MPIRCSRKKKRSPPTAGQPWQQAEKPFLRPSGLRLLLLLCYYSSMRKPFLEYLDESIIVADGAMGTQLYAKGVFLNRCFDELNLSQPALVRDIHQEYLWAGAEILETNTFGANRLKLEPHGLAGRVADINAAGVRLARDVAGLTAYVAGSIGPLGIRVEPFGKLRAEEARALFREHVAALVEAGVDLLSLETFSDLNELRQALLAVRDCCTLPVLAQVTLQDDGNSIDGTPPEDFAPLLVQWGADVIGSNCGVGPQAMLECIERISQVVDCRLSAQPNAGKPRNFEGRNLYLSSPEYFASYAKRFIRAGARIIGGCCGTTPAHIKAIRNAVQAHAVPRKKGGQIFPVAASVAAQAVPAANRSRLAERLTAGPTARLVAITPPQGIDVRQTMETARFLKSKGVDAICVSDAPGGRAAMNAPILAALLQRETGAETIPAVSCANRSLLSMQSEILGLFGLGVRNILLTAGDPLRVGEFIDATAVLEADPAGVTLLLNQLGEGKDLGGKKIGDPAAFFTGVMVDTCAPDLDSEIHSLERKIESGAHYAVTEPVFSAEHFERFLERAKRCRVPIIASVRAITSFREADLMRNETAGASVPDSLLSRVMAAGSPEGEIAEGLRFAQEIVQALRGMAQGLMVSGRSSKIREIAEILDA
jgi:methionine synthase / methylenetetrahydrofolate reductase(NADPH)